MIQMGKLKNKNVIKFLVGYIIKFQSEFQIISEKMIFVSKWMLGWNNFFLQELINWSRLSVKKLLLLQKATFQTMVLLILT